MPQSFELSGQAPAGGDSLETLVARAGEIGVVQIVNAIIREALQEDASAVHLVPRRSGGIVRCRVGGELRQTLVLPSELLFPVIARLKLMAGLDLSERRVPRQGHIPIECRQQPYDVSLATMPTLFGESVVMRIVNQARAAGWTWEKLEFDAIAAMQALLSRPGGLVLFSGPPGSGKTAALFGALHALDTERLNIVAVMDENVKPREAINLSAAGLPPSEAIRALMERDADVIVVDEAREPAQIEAALEAALAGHLILAVFPASDVVRAIEGLAALGIPARQLGTALSGVVASRLARRVCPDCREADHPGEERLRALGIAPEQAAAAGFARGRGCDDCRGTGCRGRVGLYQVVAIDAATAPLIAEGVTGDRLHERLAASGLRPFRELAATKALAGVIAVDEALRFVEE